MANVIKFKYWQDNETKYIPIDKIYHITSDVEYDEDINHEKIDEWRITFYYGEPDNSVPNSFWFDNKQEIYDILKQLEDKNG